MCTCISQQICTYWLQLLETLGMELFVAEMLFVSYLCFCFLFVLLFFVCFKHAHGRFGGPGGDREGRPGKGQQSIGWGC